MADLGLARPVSLAGQIRLVAGLRWRMMINSLRKKNNVLDFIGMGFAALVATVLIIAPSFGFYIAGYSLVSGGRMQWLPTPFWVIFVFWQVIPIFAVGFGSTFEFRVLLRFPFNAGAFYVIGLAYGLANFPALASICWLLFLTAGATVARPSVLPVMLLVTFLIILLNVSLERLISSWLERLLAKRRSRELFLGLFILVMFSTQFIVPLHRQYVKSHANPAAFAGLVKYLAPLPPSLSARAVAGAIRHDFGDIAVGLSGLSGFVFLFSALLWQRYTAQYRGEELSESPAPSRFDSVRARPKLSTDQVTGTGRTTPGLLPPLIGPIFRKELLYLFRNGFAFFLLVLPPAQILLFSSQFAGRLPRIAGRALSADLFFPAMMAYTVLMVIGPAYNAFAYEGRGIQTYFTAPLTFSDILVAKNMMTAAVIGFEVTLCAVVLARGVGAPSFPTALATVFALIFTACAQLPIANWASLSFPRKLDFGSMRGQRNSGVSVWIMFGAQIVLGGISALVLSAARWSGNPWLAAEGFAFLGAAALGGYLASLQPLSELAEKKKEILIEALCR